ncbi:unnamed protein product [Calicophoron daubneyi]
MPKPRGNGEIHYKPGVDGDPGDKRVQLPQIFDHEPQKTASQKIQGPFKDPEEVRLWKSKPLPLSLRVLTDYFALNKAREELRGNEWAKRVHDELFRTGRVHSPAYKRLLMTRGEYGTIPYGTKHFRSFEDLGIHYRPEQLHSAAQEEEEGEVCRPMFNTVLPPIPLFDRYNCEYIRGYVKR